MNDLLGEEKEYDGIFWEQNIFKETLSDDEYKTESEKEDHVDDDFFYEESSENETQEPKFEKKVSEKPKTQKRVKKKRLKIEKIVGITQKEMLEQAAIVEMYNQHDLKKLVSLEQNSKNNLIRKKDKIQTSWRYLDSLKSGKRKIVIWHSDPLVKFCAKSLVKKTCAITGGLARFTDPLTGLHYSSKEAFKKIRDDYYAQQEKTIQDHIANLQNELNSLNN